MAMLNRAVVRSRGSWRMNRRPSTVPDQKPSGRSWASGTPAPGTRIRAVRARDRANPAAVTQRVVAAPTVAMRRPPMPGPTRKADVPDGLVHAVGPFETPARLVGGGGQEGLPRSDARRVERGAEGGEGDEQADGQPDGGVGDRDGGHRKEGQQVGDDRGPAAPEPVHDGARHEAGRDQRERGRGGDGAGGGGAAGELQGEPGEGDHGHAVAHARDEAWPPRAAGRIGAGDSPIQGGRPRACSPRDFGHPGSAPPDGGLWPTARRRPSTVRPLGLCGVWRGEPRRRPVL